MSQQKVTTLRLRSISIPDWVMRSEHLRSVTAAHINSTPETQSFVSFARDGYGGYLWNFQDGREPPRVLREMAIESAQIRDDLKKIAIQIAAVEFHRSSTRAMSHPAPETRVN